MSSSRSDRIVYFYETLEEAKKRDYTLTIKCRDDRIVYSSIAFFTGIEYFSVILDSGMKESFTKECVFEYLTVEELIIYINTILNGYPKSRTPTSEEAINLYIQAHVHQNTKVINQIKRFIEKLPYSSELYSFNTTYQLITIDVMVSKYIEEHNSCIKNDTNWFDGPSPPHSNDFNFWKLLIDRSCNQRLSIAWVTCWKFLPKETLKEVLKSYSKNITIAHIKALESYPENDKSDELLMIYRFAVDKMFKSRNT